MTNKTLGLLDQKLETQIKGLQDSLGTGTAKDYADYQFMCGKIRGLLTAQMELNDLAKNLEHSDE
jgi:hypothetical protein